MTAEGFGQESWEQRWENVLQTHADALANRPANADLIAVASELAPGRALDAGCGHGAETLWLAGHAWRVTAVDFARTALDIGRSTADSLGDDVAARIDWTEGDLGLWAPSAGEYDLVSCLYVHVAGSVVEMVTRLASGVAPGGTLLMIGHLDTPGQQQVTVPEAVAALDPGQWGIVVAEERVRAVASSGSDAVIRAVRAG